MDITFDKLFKDVFDKNCNSNDSISLRNKYNEDKLETALAILRAIPDNRFNKKGQTSLF